jgi:hypothetical protein
MTIQTAVLIETLRHHGAKGFWPLKPEHYRHQALRDRSTLISLAEVAAADAVHNPSSL